MASADHGRCSALRTEGAPVKRVTTEKRGNKWAWKVRTPRGDADSSAEYDTKAEAQKAGEAEAEALERPQKATLYDIWGTR